MTQSMGNSLKQAVMSKSVLLSVLAHLLVYVFVLVFVFFLRQMKHTCDQCGAGFPRLRELARHVKDHAHGKKARSTHPVSLVISLAVIVYVFRACVSLSFLTHALFLSASVVVLCVSFVQFDCEECDRSFVSRSLLDQHLSTEHSIIKTYVCEQCQENFRNCNDYDKHMKTSHPEDSASEKTTTKVKDKEPEKEDVVSPQPLLQLWPLGFKDFLLGCQSSVHPHASVFLCVFFLH